MDKREEWIYLSARALPIVMAESYYPSDKINMDWVKARVRDLTRAMIELADNEYPRPASPVREFGEIP